MGRKSLAAVAFTLLIAPQMVLGQAPSPSRQPSTPQIVPSQQAGTTQSSATSSQATRGAQPAQTTRQQEELRADILMARKQYADAALLYQKLVEQEPKNALLLNKLGIAYHQQNLLDQAKRCYERAVKADRTYANAYNNIGTIYYQRKNYRKAIHAYKKALAIRLDIPAAHSNLGYAYFAQKHYDEALAAFRQALDLDPEVFERSQYAGSLLQDRSVDDRGLFYYFLAKSFATAGNADRCAHYLRKARDEGYKGWTAALNDPAFAGVINDPRVQEVLRLNPPSASQTPPAPPGF